MPTTPKQSPLRVILPLLPGADVAAHIPLAADLAGPAGHVTLLVVVPGKHGEDLPAANRAAREARRQLRSLARLMPDGIAHEEVVRAAESPARGIWQVSGESGGEAVLIMPLPTAAAVDAMEHSPYVELLASPACDTVFSRAGAVAPLRSVLVSARGGPHADFALDVAQRVGRAQGASVTVMHVDVPMASPGERQQEQRLFQSLVARSGDIPRLRTSSVPADSASEAIVAESRRHDLVVLGARMSEGSDGGLGDIPCAALEQSTTAVLVVKSRMPVNVAIFRPRQSDDEADLSGGGTL
jgi:nucleotide-binding universal stress UspA family protein